jgi:formate dehydrogenase maturation protein FdhE
MSTLVWTRGRGFPLSRLESRLRCPNCGSRDVVLLITIPRETQAARAAKCRQLFPLRATSPF